jgi:hypothetical protein
MILIWLTKGGLSGDQMLGNEGGRDQEELIGKGSSDAGKIVLVLIS